MARLCQSNNKNNQEVKKLRFADSKAPRPLATNQCRHHPLNRWHQHSFYYVLISIVTTLTLAFIASVDAHAQSQRITPLPPEQAFRINAKWQDNQVFVIYQMIDGVYLYRDRLMLTTTTKGATIHMAPLPDGVVYKDPFFGQTTIYYNAVTLSAKVTAPQDAIELIALSQGCDEQVGICYPPLIQTLVLTTDTADSTIDNASYANQSDLGDSSYITDIAGDLAKRIKNQSLLWTIVLFFVLGVGLSLTPCVLPLLPILLAIIGGRDNSRRQVIVLTALYISGMVVAFTLAGVIAALGGQLLSTWLQTPPILITTGIIFGALGFSLLTNYQLTLPTSWQTKINALGKGGTPLGVFAMGVLSMLVVSPCVAPPLIGVLIYIGQTQDVVVGATTLAALSLGMSTLLLIAGVGGSVLLPKTNQWHVALKPLFGTLLLFVSVWTVSPLLTNLTTLLLYATLLIFCGLLAWQGSQQINENILLTTLTKTLAILTLLWGILLFIGIATGNHKNNLIFSPLSSFSVDFESGVKNQTTPSLTFKTVANSKDLNRLLTTTQKPIMLEFYADWCVSCKEFEYFTLSDENVKQALQAFVLLRADVTDNTKDQRTLLKRFNLFGPPAIVFFNHKGQLIEHVRITGYQNVNEFLQTLSTIKRPKKNF